MRIFVNKWNVNVIFKKHKHVLILIVFLTIKELSHQLLIQCFLKKMVNLTNK